MERWGQRVLGETNASNTPWLHTVAQLGVIWKPTLPSWSLLIKKIESGRMILQRRSTCLRFSVFVLRFGIQQAAICIHCSLCTPKTVLLFLHFKLGPSAHWGEGSRVLSQQIGVERGRRGGGTAHGVGWVCVCVSVRCYKEMIKSTRP